MIGLWLKLKEYLIAAGAVLVLIATIFFKGKSAGREQAVAKQREIDDEARKRVSLVKPADSGSTIDSLRKGKF